MLEVGQRLPCEGCRLGFEGDQLGVQPAQARGIGDLRRQALAKDRRVVSQARG